MGSPHLRLVTTTKRNGESAILLDYHYRLTPSKTARLYWQTRISVLRKLWNKDKEQARLIAGYEKRHELINQRLKEMRNATEEIYMTFQMERRAHLLTPQVFRQELDARFFGMPRIATQTEGNLFQWIDQYLAQCSADPNTAIATLKILRTAREHLANFEKFIERPLSLEDFDLATVKAFVQYLRENTGAKTDNTILKITFSGLRKFLSEAHAAGRLKDARFMTVTPQKLGLKKTAADDVYLRRSEMKQLFEAPLSGIYAKVRDCFIGACFLGLRISDFPQVTADKIKEVNGCFIIDIITEKTSERVVMPVHPILMAILQKNGGRLPLPDNFNPKIVAPFNSALKEAARQAGFTHAVQRTRRAGKVVILEGALCDMLSSKSARESFFSTALDAGIPRHDARKMMGHRGAADISEGYDRRDKIEVALRYADHPFFTTW